MTVKNIIWKTVLICSILWLVKCAPQCLKRKFETIKCHKTGESIAPDNLIQQYEREHQKFYKEETKDGDCHLNWPALANKNLYNYCGRYLQYSVPKINRNSTIGVQITRILHYKKENTNTISMVDIVCCKVKRRKYVLKYYITRAPEPNCVYALKSKEHWEESSNWRDVILIIIQKHCDFEEERKPYSEIASKINLFTGQPIAKDTYLLEYEYEHKEMLEKEEKEGIQVKWPNVMIYQNLDSYCNQYVSQCFPHRTYKSIRGRWAIQTLHYQQISINDVRVPTITCQCANRSRCYHMTRALENNCVYALLRQGHNALQPFSIIFKHCDFEDPNDQQIKNKITKYEVNRGTLVANESL